MKVIVGGWDKDAEDKMVVISYDQETKCFHFEKQDISVMADELKYAIKVLEEYLPDIHE